MNGEARRALSLQVIGENLYIDDKVNIIFLNNVYYFILFQKSLVALKKLFRQKTCSNFWNNFRKIYGRLLKTRKIVSYNTNRQY